MPEGDTVWRVTRQLHEALAGQILTVSDFHVGRHATVDLTGRTVSAAVARGKHLLVRVEPDVSVHSHLGMDGAWQVLPVRRRPTGREWEIRVVLANAARQAIGWRLPVLEVVRRVDEEKAVGPLGPDLLGPDWDPEEAVRRLSKDQDRSIGEALLDQRVMAGIGNVYKSEICFLRGVSPFASVSEAGDLHALVDLAHRLLVANKSNASRITAGDRSRRTWVYRQSTCARCASRIERVTQGTERVTYLCPHCQPAPSR